MKPTSVNLLPITPRSGDLVARSIEINTIRYRYILHFIRGLLERVWRCCAMRSREVTRLSCGAREFEALLERGEWESAAHAFFAKSGVRCGRPEGLGAEQAFDFLRACCHYCFQQKNVSGLLSLQRAGWNFLVTDNMGQMLIDVIKDRNMRDSIYYEQLQGICAQQLEEAADSSRAEGSEALNDKIYRILRSLDCSKELGCISLNKVCNKLLCDCRGFLREPSRGMELLEILKEKSRKSQEVFSRYRYWCKFYWNRLYGEIGREADVGLVKKFFESHRESCREIFRESREFVDMRASCAGRTLVEIVKVWEGEKCTDRQGLFFALLVRSRVDALALEDLRKMGRDLSPVDIRSIFSCLCSWDGGNTEQLLGELVQLFALERYWDPALHQGLSGAIRLMLRTTFKVCHNHFQSMSEWDKAHAFGVEDPRIGGRGSEGVEECDRLLELFEEFVDEIGDRAPTLRDNLAKIIRSVKSRAMDVAAPSDGRKREDFYRGVEQHLRFFIDWLEDPSPDFASKTSKVKALRELGEAGGHCVTQWGNTITWIVRDIRGELEVETLEEKTLGHLRLYLEQIISGMASKFSCGRREEVHCGAAVARCLHERRGMPIMDFQRYEQLVRFDEVDKDRVERIFDEHYSPERLIEEVCVQIQNDRDYAHLFYRWMDEKWGTDRALELLDLHRSETPSVPPFIIASMLREMGILEKCVPAPVLRGW